MATEIKMPQLSDTMNAGKILGWRKKEGDSVNRGDILAEVETEKANLEIECFQKGVLVKIIIPENETAKVGEAIAIIGEAGEVVNTPSTTRKEEKKVEEKAPPAQETPKREESFRPPAMQAPSTAGSATEERDTNQRLKISP